MILHAVLLMHNGALSLQEYFSLSTLYACKVFVRKHGPTHRASDKEVTVDKHMINNERMIHHPKMQSHQRTQSKSIKSHQQLVFAVFAC